LLFIYIIYLYTNLIAKILISFFKHIWEAEKLKYFFNRGHLKKEKLNKVFQISDIYIYIYIYIYISYISFRI